MLVHLIAMKEAGALFLLTDAVVAFCPLLYFIYLISYLVFHS